MPARRVATHPVCEVVELFLASCREAGRAEQTIRYYDGGLKKFVRRFRNDPFELLKPTEITGFVKVTERAYKTSSVKGRDAKAINRLQNWAIEEQILEKPIVILPVPPTGQRDRIATAAETERLLAEGSPAFRRIYNAIRLSGARPGELCRARIKDWDRERQTIELQDHKTSKATGKPRRIPVSPKFADLLKDCIGERTEGAIFLSPTGVEWQVDHLSRTFKRAARRANLPNGLTLFCARHEFGTELCRKSGIELARTVLGHTNHRSTSRYVHYSESELAEQVNEVGPPPHTLKAALAEVMRKAARDAFERSDWSKLAEAVITSVSPATDDTLILAKAAEQVLASNEWRFEPKLTDRVLPRIGNVKTTLTRPQ